MNKQYTNAIATIAKSYVSAADAQWKMTTALYDNYDDICHDLAKAGTDFVAALGKGYRETFNLAMIARSLHEAQYDVADATAYLYAIEKALGACGASMALKAVGYVLPNKNGAGRKAVTADVAIIKAMEKLIADKKPSKAQRAAILAQMSILLK
jgi:hypothetical protein